LGWHCEKGAKTGTISAYSSASFNKTYTRLDAKG